jgi:hypothetical protein
VEGIREPHMVHLALFMQKVMTTLTRVEAIKTTQAQAHARSDGQLTKLSLSPTAALGHCGPHHAAQLTHERQKQRPQWRSQKEARWSEDHAECLGKQWG